MSLTDRIAHLRALAIIDTHAGSLQVAIIDMLGDLAEAVDQLVAAQQPPLPPRPPWNPDQTI